MVTNQFQNPNDTIIDLEDVDIQKNEVTKNNEQEKNIEHIEVTTTTSTQKPIVTTTTKEPEPQEIVQVKDVEDDNQYDKELKEEFDPILQKLKKSEENKKESRFINLTDF